MANLILTPSMIAREALSAFKNKLGFTQQVDKQYSSEFANKGAKAGNTITVRKPPRFTVSDGPALNIQNVIEESVPLVLSSQKHVDFLFQSVDLTLTIDKYKERYLDNAVIALANKVDLDGLQLAGQTTANFVGTPAANGWTALLAMQAHQKLNEMACPQDSNRNFFINPSAQPVIVNDLKGLFQSSERIAAQYERGMMGQGLGAEWYLAQNVWSRTIGLLGGTPLISGAGQTGTSLATKGWTASVTGLLNIGDCFTIAGVNAVNPITKQSTGSLQQFIVTAIANSDGSGNATLSIYPAITTSGPLQTVTAGPAANAAMTMSGTSAQVTPQSILCHKQAFTLGTADLEKPEGVDFSAVASDPESGLSIRIVRAYDINSDTFPCRLDILYGWAAFRPEWSCRVQG